MKCMRSAIATSLWFLPVSIYAQSTPPITPEFIVGTALLHGDEAALIDNEATTIGSSSKRIDSAFVTTIDGRLAVTDAQAESSQPFSPNSTKGTTLSAGASRLFETGTMIRGEVMTSQRDLKFDAPSAAAGKSYETSASLSLRQSLWRNAFGKAVRLRRDAAALADKGTVDSIADRKSQYAVTVSGLFFHAWQAIAQVRAAERRLARQEELLRITRVKSNRGTAEAPDLLQVEAGAILAADRVKDARNQVDDIWQQLVILLKLPSAYAAMDPTKLDIRLGDVMPTVEASCSEADPASFARMKSATAAVDAATAQLAATRSDRSPDVFFEARYSANGIDAKQGKSISETTGRDHPTSSFAIGVEMPLGYPRTDADLQETLRQKNAAEIRLSQVRSQYATDRPILCTEVKRLQERKTALESALKKTTARAKEETNRFRLGKIDAFNVIQAENDLTDTQTAIDILMADLHQVAWRLLYLSDRLVPYMQPYLAAAKS